MLYEQQHSWWFGPVRHSAASLPGEVRHNSWVLLPPVANVRADDNAYQKNSAAARNRGSPVSSKRRAAPITYGTCVFICSPRNSSRCCASGVRNSFFWNRSPAFAQRRSLVRAARLKNDSLIPPNSRSEERRVGKECRSRWS